MLQRAILHHQCTEVLGIVLHRYAVKRDACTGIQVQIGLHIHRTSGHGQACAVIEEYGGHTIDIGIDQLHTASVIDYQSLGAAISDKGIRQLLIISHKGAIHMQIVRSLHPQRHVIAQRQGTVCGNRDIAGTSVAAALQTFRQRGQDTVTYLAQHTHISTLCRSRDAGEIQRIRPAIETQHLRSGEHHVFHDDIHRLLHAESRQGQVTDGEPHLSGQVPARQRDSGALNNAFTEHSRQIRGESYGFTLQLFRKLNGDIISRLVRVQQRNGGTQ